MATAKKNVKKKTITRRPWSDKDIAKLSKLASTRPVGVIADEMGRTEAALRNKAHAEGISFRAAKRTGKTASKKKSARKK